MITSAQSRTRSRRHRPWYRRIVRGVRTKIYLVLFGVLAALIVFFAFQATRATASLRLAASQAEVLQSQIAGGDVVGARSTLGALKVSTERARSNSAGSLWDIGSKVPFLGRNVAAVQTVSEVLDEITTDALPPIVSVAENVNANAFSPRNGKVDLAALTTIAPAVGRADRALTAAKLDISKIDADSLLVPLRVPIRSVQNRITTAQSAAASGELATRLLPSMLGQDGARRYMLLIQNNAEVRSTGGISGSFAILKAKRGKLSMGRQGSIQDLRPFDKPVLKATKGESAVYSSSLFTDLRDVNFTPDFPRTGAITAAMVKKSFGDTIDGVISVDPVALSYVLTGTGPVELADGTVLTDIDAVDQLLSGVYAKYSDPGRQDDFFASAARQIFNKVKAGTGQSRLVIGGLVKATSENRLTVWSTRPNEQREIAPTRLSGVLAGDAGATPHVGLYLNDGASTKMEYYLTYRTAVRATDCLAGGAQELVSSTYMVSEAPKGLPASITGLGRYAPKGSMLINARFYSPFKGYFTRVEVNGKPQTIYADRHMGRNVTKVSLLIKPGQEYVVTTTMMSGKGQENDAIFSTTPGVNPTPNHVIVPSACD